MHTLTFPVPIYGRDWSHPIKLGPNEEITQSKLYELIQRGLVCGIGSWTKVRKICLVDTNNLSAVGRKPTKKGYRLKFPIPDVIDKTTQWQFLPGVCAHVIRHHAERCSAARPQEERIPWV